MNYAVIFTDAERKQLADALALFVEKLTKASPVIEDQAGNKPPLLCPDPTHRHNDGCYSTFKASAATPSPAQSPAAAAPPPRATPEARDRWARNRKGVELPNPEGSYPVDVYIWKTTQAGAKWLAVTWENPAGAGHVDAKCFDGELWPWLLQAKGQPRTRLYLVRNGDYLNIVGVRA